MSAVTDLEVLKAIKETGGVSLARLLEPATTLDEVRKILTRAHGAGSAETTIRDMRDALRNLDTEKGAEIL